MTTTDIPQTLSAQLGEIPTPVLADALDRLGYHGAMSAIAPVVPSGARIVGPARTVLQGPKQTYAAGPEVRTRHSHFVDFELRAGEILVISTPPNTGVSTWGHLLSLRCTRIGAAGTVIDGSIRDVAAVAALGYPVFTRVWSHSPAGSKGALETFGLDVPITCGEVLVRPGDLIVGDDSGVVACPREALDDLLQVAGQLVSWEEEAIRRVEAGGFVTG